MRALRTIPVMIEMANEMLERCPEGLLFNDTNRRWSNASTWSRSVSDATDVKGIPDAHLAFQPRPAADDLPRFLGRGSSGGVAGRRPDAAWEGAERDVARCITCGTQLHPERAEKYDYCTGADCQAKNARGMTIASVGVNKAADQFVILDERTRKEMAAGRYQDARRASPISPAQPPSPRRRTHAATAGRVLHPSERSPESWTEAQQNLALALHITGRKTLDEISERLELRPDTVARMIVAAKRRWRR